jgi:hypothetical protein
MSGTSISGTSMSATLVVARPARLADLVWPYELVLDGQRVDELRTGGAVCTPISAGTHTLRIRSLHIVSRCLKLGSPTATFEVGENETVQFACHPLPFLKAAVRWFACLFGDRNRWIVLTRADAVPSDAAGRPRDTVASQA